MITVVISKDEPLDRSLVLDVLHFRPGHKKLIRMSLCPNHFHALFQWEDPAPDTAIAHSGHVMGIPFTADHDSLFIYEH